MPFIFDSYYLLLVLPAIALALLAQARVSGTFNKYSKVASSRGLTGAAAAAQVLRAAGVFGVRIEHISGKLNDHYDPRSNTIRLSDAVYGSTSVAAVGVAAHEAGHAIQYAEAYAPMKIRAAIIPATQLGSSLAMPLVLLGLFFSIEPLYILGILAFAMVFMFQVVTLPVEFNASRRALRALETTYALDEEEHKGARKVLSAAALTYLAAMAVSLAQLIRLLALGRRRR